jgi:hypothetical protein
MMRQDRVSAYVSNVKRRQWRRRLVIQADPVLIGEVGVPYTGFTVTAEGGNEPYVFGVASGSLPDGLTLNSSTGAVAGTPTDAGTFDAIVISVEDNVLREALLPAFTIEVS